MQIDERPALHAPTCLPKPIPDEARTALGIVVATSDRLWPRPHPTEGVGQRSNVRDSPDALL